MRRGLIAPPHFFDIMWTNSIMGATNSVKSFQISPHLLGASWFAATPAATELYHNPSILLTQPFSAFGQPSNAIWRQEGVQELDVTLVVRPLRWFFCLLDVGPFILFLVFLPFLVFWFFSYWQGFIIENQFIPLNPDGPESDPRKQWPNCTQLLHSTRQWIVKQTVLQSRGFSRLPLECGGNLKRNRKEKANSQALTASGALPKSMYNRFLKSLRHSRRGNQ